MSDNAQMDAIKRYARLIEKQTGKAVRPYRMDGYVNLMNRYGTSKDPSEHYNFQREPDIPDDVLTTIYEGNGLFAKIIDTPAEEAIKHGFTLKDVSDKAVEEFVTEALDELDWEELAMTAIRWTRLFGGAIAVMLINDGGRLEDPLNWRKIKSIDDIRVYERVVVQPEYESMFNYDPTDPFSTRGSRLGMPEYYQVCSRYGNFRVHDSRCLVFQNGVLPENATNSLYRLWGIPEYIRIHRALKDAELAHESAPKLLDRSVQAIYKMKGLSQLMATEQGESQVLRRLQVIDMARGMLNSLVIDSEGEDYDFKTFQFNGITDVVSASCNMLSAITSIPQTILFGQGVGGLSTTDDTSMENYYNYIERIQKRMLRKNLRYLLSIIFQAGLYTGEVDEVPKLNVEFNPLWSLNDTEQATLEQQKAATELTKAQTAQAYIQMEAIDPSEVRKGLADSDEFDVETLLDELDDGEEDLFSDMPDMEGGAGSQNPPESGTGPQKIFEPGHFADYAEGVDVKEHDTDPGKNGSPTPASAPAATKLPQDMSDEEKLKAAEAPTNPDKKPAINAQGDGNTTSSPDDEKAGVGVLVLKDGKVLVGTRESESGYGLICGPGGHIKVGETPTQAAFRETEEEFGISPTELIPIGRGPAEPDTGIKPYVFLCTEYHGDLHCVDGEMKDPKFLSLEEIDQLKPSLFQPFMDGVEVLKAVINNDDPDPDGPDHDDGGPGSGNFGHKGREGEIGGSEEREGSTSPYDGETSRGLERGVYSAKKSEWSKNAGRELSDREVQEMVDATSDYTRNYKNVVAASAGYSGVYASRGSLMDSEEKATAEKSAAAIEKAISLSDKYAGTTKRAMTMDKDAFDKFIAESSGSSAFGLGHLSSWSTGDDALKRVFRSRDGDDPDLYNVVLECKSKSGVSIKDVADVDMDEVLYSKKARFKVLDTDPYYSVGKYKAVKLTLEEVGNRGDSSDLDGGPGSGNHGHEGIPGEVGGSAPSASSLNDSIRNASKKGYMEVDKQVRSTLKDVPVGTKFTQKGVKYTKTAENEFTADNGRKATVNAIANGINISSEASIPKFEDVKSSDIAAQKLENGELSASKAAELVPPASSEQIKQWISDPQFQRSVKAGTDPKVTAEFESFIAKQKDFNGEAYRGVGFENTEFVDSLKAGDPIDMNGISSWSKFHDVASDYSLGWDEKPVGVVFRVKNPKGSAELSESGEGEILLSGKSRLRVKKVSKVSDDGDYIVDVENYDGGPRSGNNGNISRKTDGNVYSSENPIDFQAETDTITSKDIINDGAPKGNDNAAGPHKRSHLSSSDKAKYRNRIVGQKTSDGVQVKGFSNHAFDRIAQRNLSPKRIEDMLRSQNVSPDKTYQNRRCYDVKGSRLVLDHTTGTIVTIEWRKQNR